MYHADPTAESCAINQSIKKSLSLSLSVVMAQHGMPFPFSDPIYVGTESHMWEGIDKRYEIREEEVEVEEDKDQSRGPNTTGREDKRGTKTKTRGIR